MWRFIRLPKWPPSWRHSRAAITPCWEEPSTIALPNRFALPSYPVSSTPSRQQLPPAPWAARSRERDPAHLPWHEVWPPRSGWVKRWWAPTPPAGFSPIFGLPRSIAREPESSLVRITRHEVPDRAAGQLAKLWKLRERSGRNRSPAPLQSLP